MESFKKIIFLVLALSAGCAGQKEAPFIVQDPLVLEEITPLPRAVIIAPVLEYEPVYSVMRIIEVSELNGVQKFFLVRSGTDKAQIREGQEAEIGDDGEFRRIIGNCVIIDVYGDFFRCEIQRLDYRIGPGAHIRIRTGERLKS